MDDGVISYCSRLAEDNWEMWQLSRAGATLTQTDVKKGIPNILIFKLDRGNWSR